MPGDPLLLGNRRTSLVISLWGILSFSKYLYLGRVKYLKTVTIADFHMSLLSPNDDRIINGRLVCVTLLYLLGSRTPHTLVLSHTTKGTDRDFIFTHVFHAFSVLDWWVLKIARGQNIQIQESKVLKLFHIFMYFGNPKLYHCVRHCIVAMKNRTSLNTSILYHLVCTEC